MIFLFSAPTIASRRLVILSPAVELSLSPGTSPPWRAWQGCRCPPSSIRSGNARDLLEGFPFAVDDFGHAVTQLPVMVDMGVGDILEGQITQPVKCILDIDFSASDVLKQFGKVVFVHSLPVDRVKELVRPKSPCYNLRHMKNLLIATINIYDRALGDAYSALSSRAIRSFTARLGSFPSYKSW